MSRYKSKGNTNDKKYATADYGRSSKLNRLDDAEIQNLIDQYQSQSAPTKVLVGTGGKVYSGSAVLKLKLAQWRKRINP
mgnify:CR=1 FL=1